MYPVPQTASAVNQQKYRTEGPKRTLVTSRHRKNTGRKDEQTLDRCCTLSVIYMSFVRLYCATTPCRIIVASYSRLVWSCPVLRKVQFQCFRRSNTLRYSDTISFHIGLSMPAGFRRHVIGKTVKSSPENYTVLSAFLFTFEILIPPCLSYSVLSV